MRAWSAICASFSVAACALLADVEAVTYEPRANGGLPEGSVGEGSAGGGDAALPPDAASVFCTNRPGVAFCADFDSPTTGEPLFTRRVDLPGAGRLDPRFVSASRGYVLVAAAGATSVLEKAGLPANDEVVFEVSALLSPASHAFASLSFEGPDTPCNVILHSDHVEVLDGIEQRGQAAFAPQVGVFRPYRITLTNEAGPSMRVEVRVGETAVLGPLSVDCSDGPTAQIVLGRAASTAQFEDVFDNVVFSARKL